MFHGESTCYNRRSELSLPSFPVKRDGEWISSLAFFYSLFCRILRSSQARVTSSLRLGSWLCSGRVKMKQDVGNFTFQLLQILRYDWT